MLREQTNFSAYPLHVLCQDAGNLNNNAIGLQECLQQISDINALDDNDYSALDYAVSTGSEELVKFLLDHGALPPSPQPTQSIIPLVHQAIENKHEKIALMLLKKFPTLEEKLDYYKNTPLLYAIAMGCSEVSDYLINRKSITINTGNNIGKTPLWMAAYLGLESVVSRLLANGAMWDFGTYSADGPILPITVAANQNHYKVVDLLSEYSYSLRELTLALHYTTSNMINRCRDPETRKNMEISAKKLQAKLLAMKSKLNHVDKNLTLEDAEVLTWEDSFAILFGQEPSEKYEHPRNKDAAIRHALASMLQLLSNPKECLPYLHQISERLETHWQNETHTSFPKFDEKAFDLWSHHNHVWPIPNEKFKPLKKHHMLSRVLLDIFKQYGMGTEQTKWTGFVSPEVADAILKKGGYFTENRRTINGLFHGNTHRIHWALLLLAIQSGAIPLSYKNEQGQEVKLEAHEVFSALVRKDLRLDGQQVNCWATMLDSFSAKIMSFRQPHLLHSFIMTGKELSDTALQRHMVWSFGQFMNETCALYNHIYSTHFSNMELCEEVISGLYTHLFADSAELAIQREERPLEKVTKIDDLKGENLRQFAIHPKTYAPLKEIKKSEPEEKAKFTALHQAAVKNLNNIDSLIDQGIAVDSETHRKWTPLHYAAARGHVEAVKSLLKRGANPKKVNENGSTPADLAVEFGKDQQDPKLKENFGEVLKMIETHIRDTHSPVSIVKCLIANSAIYESVNESSEGAQLSSNKERVIRNTVL